MQFSLSPPGVAKSSQPRERAGSSPNPGGRRRSGGTSRSELMRWWIFVVVELIVVAVVCFCAAGFGQPEGGSAGLVDGLRQKTSGKLSCQVSQTQTASGKRRTLQSQQELKSGSGKHVTVMKEVSVTFKVKPKCGSADNSNVAVSCHVMSRRGQSLLNIIKQRWAN